jgi:glycosyltransferase involved in cell wall biosynthesis
MKATVIVPTYNRPDALEKVLCGLNHQTRLADEVIVADDGSGPETKLLLNALQKTVAYPLRHVWQADDGFRLSMIRNQAILQATGQYIILLDGDCVPNRFFVTDHLRLAKKGYFFQGKRVLVGQRATPDFTCKTANCPKMWWPLVLERQVANAHHLLRIPWFPATTSKRLSGIRGCNMGLFREDLFTVNGFNEDFIGWGREDQEIVTRFYAYGLRRRNQPFMAICFHLWHPEQERSSLEENELKLEQTIKDGSYYIPNGLIKSGSGH